MWTWGGRIFNWKRYLENMRACRMDSAVLWHYHAPANAGEIQDYAHELGIKIIWGFNWSWGSPVCLDSKSDAATWSDTILKILETEYMPLNPDGICFQVGGTELDAKCRLDCDTCRKGYEEGIGELYVKFAGSLMESVQKRYPGLPLYANLHMGAMRETYASLEVIDPSVTIMWEDLPGPGFRLEAPFAYDWAPDEAATSPYMLDMVRKMCELRGPDEKVSFIVKGFPFHWGGYDPMLLEDFELKALATVYKDKWDAASIYCEKRLPEVLEVFRIIAESPARSKMVLLLVEHGLWEYKRYHPAVLIAEALRDPFRDPIDIIQAARDISDRE